MLNLETNRDMADRERHIFIAKLAEQSEKYDGEPIAKSQFFLS